MSLFRRQPDPLVTAMQEVALRLSHIEEQIANLQQGGGMDALVTKEAFAQRMEVSQKTVERYISRGMPVAVREGRVVRLDPEQCVRWLTNWRARRARRHMKAAAITGGER